MSIVTFAELGRLGRFANGLWEIMGSIGIARKNGYEYKFPLWINHDAKDRFGSTEDIDIYKHLANPLPLMDTDYPRYVYYWGYHDIVLNGNADIWGQFQCDKYFNHCIDEVREVLRFKDEPPLNDLIAIHFRAGDYTEGVDGHHPRCTREYYEKAMALFPGKKFRIYTDATDDEVLNVFGEWGILHLHRGANYIEDFKSMKSCHSFICANSSFSLGAAVLANQPGKVIVCPKQWFGNAWGNPEHMAKDIYPENCIII